MRPLASWTVCLSLAILASVFSSCKPQDFDLSRPIAIPTPGYATPSVVPVPVHSQAPGDSGNIGETHDFVVTRAGSPSVFVWIPDFVAYQLINPARTGETNVALPVGAWVSEKPASGDQNVDWVSESFGGFYVGKFEASRADARPGTATSSAGATAGSSTSIQVAQYCVPRTLVDWDEARRACKEFHPNADLISDEEWTALAIWATVSGKRVRGNTYYLRDKEDPWTTFLGDPTAGGGRALTGSATNSTWTGDTNASTHTGTTSGVHDLNGNVFEWTGTLGLDASGDVLVDDALVLEERLIRDGTRSVPIEMQSSGRITALATKPKLRRLGLPAVTSASPLDYFGGAFFFKSNAASIKSFRGGSWSGGQSSGIWYLALGYPRSYSYGDVGFRPVLRF